VILLTFLTVLASHVSGIRASVTKFFPAAVAKVIFLPRMSDGVLSEIRGVHEGFSASFKGTNVGPMLNSRMPPKMCCERPFPRKTFATYFTDVGVLFGVDNIKVDIHF
jgi:hypothetical protein